MRPEAVLTWGFQWIGTLCLLAGGLVALVCWLIVMSQIVRACLRWWKSED